MWQDRYDKQISEIKEYGSLGYSRGLICAIGGNISVRCDDGIIITASGAALRKLSSDDFVLLSSNGTLLEGQSGKKPSKESGVHICLYENPEVFCVYHAHPPYTTAFSCSGMEPPRVTSAAKNKLPPTVLIGIARAGSKQLVDLIRQVIATYQVPPNAFILQSHGVVVSGKNVQECFDLVDMIEDCARTAYYTMVIRSFGKTLSDFNNSAHGITD